MKAFQDYQVDTSKLLFGNKKHKTFKRDEAYIQYLKGAYKKVREGLFVRDCSDRMRSNGTSYDLDFQGP